MWSSVRSACLLKFHHRTLVINGPKLYEASSQFTVKKFPICFTQNVQYSINSEDLNEIRKPRSIKKYFAIDSIGSSEQEDESQLAGDALEKVELSEPSKDDGIDASSGSEETAPQEPSSWNNVMSVKYEQFDERGSRIIYDISEQELGLDVAASQQHEPLPSPMLAASHLAINLERGKTGVFDVEDLVELLRSENAKDVVAMQIPAQMVWVDHMVVVSANSQRHLNAVAQSVRKYFNARMTNKDKPLILEGRDSPWVAMDLGNIALHIMSPSERRRVDLESLWLCGPEHDLLLQEVAKANEMDEEDSFYLADIDASTYDMDSEVYDITKEYSHPFIPVHEDDILPDYSEINDDNRNTFAATSVMEMALAKHNKGYARKFRGRFKK